MNSILLLGILIYFLVIALILSYGVLKFNYIKEAVVINRDKKAIVNFIGAIMVAVIFFCLLVFTMKEYYRID